MRQKGFATIFALCMILVIALVVKGIQESEMNHVYETADFQAEFELQNAADSAIYETAEMIRLDSTTLQSSTNPYGSRKYGQFNIFSTTKESAVGSIKIEVWGERLDNNKKFKTYNKTYSPDKLKVLKDNKHKEILKTGYILLSVAEVESKQTGEKIYRRAFAYVLDGDDKTIHFMTLP